MSLQNIGVGSEFVGTASLTYEYEGASFPSTISTSSVVTVTVKDARGQALFPAVAQSSADTHPVTGAADWPAGKILVRIPPSSTSGVKTGAHGVMVVSVDGELYQQGGGVWFI